MANERGDNIDTQAKTTTRPPGPPEERRYLNRANMLLAGVLACVFIFPIVAGKNEYYLHIATLIGIYTMLSLGLNLITGFTGILTFAQASFAGVGAYTTALLLQNTHVPYMATVPLAILAAAVAGLLLSLCTLRAGGLYFSVITIGFNEIFRLIVLNWQGLTGGATGIVGIALPSIAGFSISTPRQFYYLVVAFAVASYLILRALVHSRFGHAIKAVREDPVAAASAGINVRLHTVLSFVIGTAVAGLAGNLIAVFLTTISPSNFTIDESMLIVVMNVVGGLGSLPGAVLGTAVMVVAGELLRNVYQVRLLMIGVLMVAMPIWRRGGILGTKIERRI
jgi:branched-chain amino acid transport system permease protein